MPCAYAAGTLWRISTSALATPNAFACAPRTARPVPSVLGDSRPFFSQNAMICAMRSSMCGSMVSISGVKRTKFDDIRQRSWSSFWRPAWSASRRYSIAWAIAAPAALVPRKPLSITKSWTMPS